MQAIRDITKTMITTDANVAVVAAAAKRHGNRWDTIVSGSPPLPE